MIIAIVVDTFVILMDFYDDDTSMKGNKRLVLISEDVNIDLLTTCSIPRWWN